MRKIMSIALAGVVCGASLTLATATQAAADQVPRCAKVRKYFSSGGQRYVRLMNLCTQRPACYSIVIPHHADQRGQLPKGTTKDVRYGSTATPRALYVKNVSC
ncbi:hypothetical protein K2224_39815 (plasmid) [Streptomyces sp. BHT-5-2]|uniref:hypothetical protein n=1 Tax=unclassified Streptomyces TaxID=2593676 RepID=UPI001C8ED9D7|nr:hypothetical protein [Streptomyces sp. BHT-5-2]QZL09107.1 hypothetical protein K2224_39815 [Streptomyces sp. BHT-5-2]